MKLLLYTAAIVGMVASFSAEAQQTGAINPSGGRFIQIEDGFSHACININESVVSIYLVSLKTKRTNSWFSASKSLGAKIVLTIEGPTTASDPTFTFPRARALSPIGETNIVSLPIIYNLASKLSLISPNKEPYASLGLDIQFIDIAKDTPLAKSMLALIDFTSNLPVPPNPYVNGAQTFGKFVGQLLKSETTSSDDVQPVATMTFELSTTGNCHPRDLVEGTAGVIFDYDGDDIQNVIKTADADNYCYFLDNGSVVYGRKNRACPNITGPKQSLNNPQVIYQFSAYARQDAKTLTRETAPAGSFGPAYQDAIPTDKPSYESAYKVLTMDMSGTNKAVATPSKKTLARSLKLATEADKKGAFDNTLVALGASKIAKTMAFAKPYVTFYKVNKDTALAYDTVRALSRCRLIGVPASDCQ